MEKATAKNKLELEKNLRLNNELKSKTKIIELQGQIDGNPNQVQNLKAQADIYKKGMVSYQNRSEKFDQLATVVTKAETAVDKERSKLEIRYV